jgi:hypothetical protein
LVEKRWCTTASARPAMGQVDQDLQRLVHHVVRAHAFEIAHHAHAAGVVLERRIVKPLGGRPAASTLLSIAHSHLHHGPE